MVPEQNYFAWKLVLTILHVVAMVTTIIRIFQRKHTNGLWWDDYLAIVPACMTLVQIIVMNIMFVPGDVTDQHLKLELYWILSVTWFILIWFCRISLALSIARIFPAWATPRRFAMGLSVCFGIVFVGIMCWQATLSCVGVMDPDAYLSCDVDRFNLTLFSIICDIIADVFLIASPCYMLWRIRLPTRQRRLVLTLFSSSSLTLLAAIVFTVCTYSPWVTGPGARLITAMSSQLEACVSLIVCNLVVVFTFFLRIFKKDHHDPEDIIDDKVTRHVPPTGVRPRAPTMNVTVITLTEIAPGDRAAAKYDEPADNADDSASTDGGKWSPKSERMFNVKLPDKDGQIV